jgi:hypothetical protein
MSETLRLQITATGGGRQIEGTIERTADDCAASHHTLPAASAGTLTTRSSATAGVATLAADPGIALSDTINVFWADGCRYGCDVDLVAGDDDEVITFSGGTGDDLPDQDTALFAAPRVPIVLGFDGDDLDMLVVAADARAHADFLDADGVSLHQVELTAAEPLAWHTDSWASNELTGNPVAQILASAGTGAETGLDVIVGWDNTP